MTNTIAYGGDFGQNLLTSSINQAVDFAAEKIAGSIGDTFNNTDGKNFTNYAAHGLLGCGTAVANGGNSAACAAGAAGAIAGEATAATGLLNAASQSTIGRTLTDAETAFFGGVVGGTVSASLGGQGQRRGQLWDRAGDGHQCGDIQLPEARRAQET